MFFKCKRQTKSHRQFNAEKFLKIIESEESLNQFLGHIAYHQLTKLISD